MKIIYNETEYDISEQWSRKDFTGWDLTGENLDGLVIEGSCFSHETPDSIVFRDDMKAVTFIDCNLDNCFIPDNNNVILGMQPKKFEVQNDLNDWLVDAQSDPIKPIDYEVFEKKGLPLPKPVDIPAEKVDVRIDLIAAAEALIAPTDPIDPL